MKLNLVYFAAEQPINILLVHIPQRQFIFVFKSILKTGAFSFF